MQVIGAIGGTSLIGRNAAADNHTPGRQIGLLETTVSEIRSAIISGRMSAREITEHYVSRIEAYESDPNASISVNESALDRASELDEILQSLEPSGHYTVSQSFSRRHPMHGVTCKKPC